MTQPATVGTPRPRQILPASGIERIKASIRAIEIVSDYVLYLYVTFYKSDKKDGTQRALSLSTKSYHR